MEKENNTALQPDFIPNPNINTLYPWEDVMACSMNRLDGNKMIDKNPCFLCLRNSEKLIWINFKSPDWTWGKLCGVAGNLSICPDCGVQVQFEVTIRS